MPAVLCFGDRNSGPSARQEKQNRPRPPCLVSDPSASIESHEQIFTPLPSVLLLIASVKNIIFPIASGEGEKYVFLKTRVLE